MYPLDQTLATHDLEPLRFISFPFGTKNYCLRFTYMERELVIYQPFTTDKNLDNTGIDPWDEMSALSSAYKDR